MVYAERTERHISPKDQDTSSATISKPTKYSMETRPSGSSSSSSTSNWGSQKSSLDDKWKYNNMVRNDREKFNSLNFC